MPVLSLEEIRQLSFDALRRCGANEEHATAVALELMDAEAEGIRNVGLGYIHLYLNHLKCGKVIGDAKPEIVRQSAAATLVNARHGFCHTAYLHAEEQLIETTLREGVGMLAIQQSYSAGVLGWFVRRLAQRGLVALMFANSSKAVAAHGGKVPFFGTNPFAFGSPRQSDSGEMLAPVVVDMATSSTARVNIVKAAAAGEPVELGHVIDADGNPTTDAAAGLKGAQLPVGGPKGFGLGLIVDLMGGALTGSNCSYEASMFSTNDGGPPNVGQTIIAFNPEFYSDGYLAHLETMFASLTDDNEVRIPGERRQQLREQHERDGVEVPQALLDKIADLSAV
ncbi:Ldh family oxidoreductase [Aliamphritea ceti]|uniref:Ldh family oxidoreductase n=1 Tax=Aliamphritea ceti TaxID=1524258 RepID=UPI0021C3F299|nr:Ldh family oxidoreductase [Aliamphritea ceti]